MQVATVFPFQEEELSYNIHNALYHPIQSEQMKMLNYKKIYSKMVVHLYLSILESTGWSVSASGKQKNGIDFLRFSYSLLSSFPGGNEYVIKGSMYSAVKMDEFDLCVPIYLQLVIQLQLQIET